METIEIRSNTRNLVGYDSGIKYRQEYLIDAFDLGNPVMVHISSDIYYITSSFIVGLFESSVDYFETMDEFFDHYVFACNQTVFKCILNGVQRIYRR